MDSLPPDFSAPPTFIEHTVFTKDLTGWPRCWSFDQKIPFRQSTKAAVEKSFDPRNVEFSGISNEIVENSVTFTLLNKKSYAYISPQYLNKFSRLAPMAFRPDDFPTYRVYFSGNLTDHQNNAYLGYSYLDSDHVPSTYLPPDDKYNYPKISGNIKKSLEDDRKKIQGKIVSKSEEIMAIQKDMFLSLDNLGRGFPKFNIYYDKKIQVSPFFEKDSPVKIDNRDYPIVIDATMDNSLWILTKKHMYFSSGFSTKGGFSFETRSGDNLIFYRNIDLRYMSPSDQWLLRWERAPEEKCREAFAPLVNSSVTPQEAKPIFFNE